MGLLDNLLKGQRLFFEAFAGENTTMTWWLRELQWLTNGVYSNPRSLQTFPETGSEISHGRFRQCTSTASVKDSARCIRMKRSKNPDHHPHKQIVC